VAVLGEVTDPLQVLRRIVDQAMVLVSGAEGAVVEVLIDDQLDYVCTAGTLAPYAGLRLAVTGSLSGMALNTGEILRCDDCESDGRVDRIACREVGAVSMLCVPLRKPPHDVGVLKVTSTQKSAFTERDMRVLSQLSEFITSAVAVAADASRVLGGDHESDSLSAFVANVIEPGRHIEHNSRRRIEQVLADRRYESLYQPIIDLTTNRLFGVEALTRFADVPYRSPDLWFAEAEAAGLGLVLELAAVESAVRLLPALPAGIRLSVNVGPRTIVSAELEAMIEEAGPDRIVVELTEHLRVEDYPGLNRNLQSLRERQTLLAIDDTGAGISSLTHILKLAPDIIKLDREITSGIDIDPVRRALAAALGTFAAESGSIVVAEGIESEAELAVLQDMGVRYGQGFHLGRPTRAADVLTRARR
jgi:EAL domain-containing protein (putative c-di-GMP-specific phosphodiesterase class I)